ncbi:DUF6458 family protein [Mobilicoccus pelagius]|uniref:DUF6458 domain-containing protein n=1 Tax=Mobilicoccus pelagius NBRC 104925 TaxID=1089455 RepID=H5UW34_9MICO|nr:DUF6458 family protein [Mobilicoccus pelagius]GAB49942.1 hypothetical protein MOPEL_135_01800 [Mobilicoccus pelagius NBRC 104925]
MSIGFGIFLVALGAILSFAVKDAMPGVDLTMIGYILMAAGLVTALVSATMMTRSRAVVARRATTVEDPHSPYAA